MKITFGIEQIPEIARKFINKIGNNRIYLFDGEMGVGKTTFIAEVCRQLGATDDFGSPTFSLVNEYQTADGSPVYHFDLYRIDSPQEAFDMGVEEYFNSGELCLVEWPDRLGPLTPEEAIIVKISENPDGTRTIIF